MGDAGVEGQFGVAVVVAWKAVPAHAVGKSSVRIADMGQGLPERGRGGWLGWFSDGHRWLPVEDRQPAGVRVAGVPG